MSASTYKPTTTLTPREIAIPAVPSFNAGHPIPRDFEAVQSRQVGSANPAGGYVDPAAFRDRSGA